MLALNARAENYLPGDTDLSWTRLTPWRALLAAALDQYPARIKSVTVEAERSNPSADLLAAWLQSRLKLDVTRKISDGPGSPPFGWARPPVTSRSPGPTACWRPTPCPASPSGWSR